MGLECLQYRLDDFGGDIRTRTVMDEDEIGRLRQQGQSLKPCAYTILTLLAASDRGQGFDPVESLQEQGSSPTGWIKVTWSRSASAA